MLSLSFQERKNMQAHFSKFHPQSSFKSKDVKCFIYCYSYSDKFWLLKFGLYLRKDSVKLTSRS